MDVWCSRLCFGRNRRFTASSLSGLAQRNGLMSGHKNQHYIPQSYLEPWAHRTDQGNHKKLWIHSSDDTQFEEKSLRQSFVVKELYTLQGDSGERDLSIEEQLTRIEDYFGNTKQKLLKQAPYSIEDIVNLAAFAASMTLRTLRIGEFWGTHFSDQLKELEQRIVHSPSSLSSGLNFMTPRSAVISNSFQWSENGLEELREVVNDPLRQTLPTGLRSLTEQIAQIPFVILSTESPEGFITSDHPCVFYDRVSGSNSSFPFALGTSSPTLEISLPLSPTTLVLWGRTIGQSSIGNYVHIGLNNLNRLNIRTRRSAFKYIVTKLPAFNRFWI